MPRKSPPPVSSFGPELLAALIRGGEGVLRVPLDSFESAVVLRQRFYALRQAMRRENHPLATIAYRASISPPAKAPSADGKWYLTIKPHDEQFTAALRAAGVEALPLEANPLEGVDVVHDLPPSGDWLSTILAGVGEDKKKA